MGQAPSTATLVELVKGMVRHFLGVAEGPDEEEAQRLRLMTTSHLEDGEFARLLYAKVGNLIGPVFVASLDRAVEAGDASRIGSEPLNLFWFAHHTVLMAALSRSPAVPCLTYGNAPDLERQLCEFLLRGIGLHEAAITSHLSRGFPAEPAPHDSRRKCMTMNIVTEPKISGKPISDKARARPVRMVRWFIIVGVLLAAVGRRFGLFQPLPRQSCIKRILSPTQPPPTPVSIATPRPK